jgi:hypothetical protein
MWYSPGSRASNAWISFFDGCFHLNAHVPCWECYPVDLPQELLDEYRRVEAARHKLNAALEPHYQRAKELWHAERRERARRDIEFEPPEDRAGQAQQSGPDDTVARDHRDMDRDGPDERAQCL